MEQDEPILEHTEEPVAPKETAPKVTSSFSGKALKDKPLIEGINAPVVNNGGANGMLLTNSEKKLINDMEPSRQGPQIHKASEAHWQPEGVPSWKKVVGWLVTVVVIVVAGVGGYIWFSKTVKNQPITVKTTPSVNITTQQPTVTIPEQTANPTSTPATVTPPATSTPTTTTAVNQVKVTDTPTGFLNVRSTPSTTGAQLTQVHPGEVYVYTDTKNGWYNISLPDGTTGWVIGTYVTKVTPVK